MENLEKLTRLLEMNTSNKIKRQEIIQVYNGDQLLVTIYSGEKYAQFHEPFHQTGGEIKELRPFIEELKNQNYDFNLD